MFLDLSQYKLNNPALALEHARKSVYMHKDALCVLENEMHKNIGMFYLLTHFGQCFTVTVRISALVLIRQLGQKNTRTWDTSKSYSSVTFNMLQV